jgi:small subunit ribosomal protein S20
VKRVQVAERNRRRNIAYKSAVRTAIKKALSASGDSLQAALNNAYSVIDRAITKGVLHANTGARYKARVAKAANSNKVA